jgi:hypothetical protein
MDSGIAAPRQSAARNRTRGWRRSSEAPLRQSEYTINDARLAQRPLRAGADGIITNNPPAIRQALDKLDGVTLPGAETQTTPAGG